MNVRTRALPAVCALAFAAPLTLASEARAEDEELPSARKLALAAKVCERAWHKQEEPRRNVTRRCAEYWLFAYNYSLRAARESGVESALSLDPRVTGVEVTRFPRAQFTAMAKHARKLPRRTRDGDDWIAIRAVEYFEGAAKSTNSLAAIGACSGTLDCLLRTIFKDKKLASNTVRGLDAVHLRTLRHAVYARHGRRFKDRQLDKLFYTDVAKKPSGGLLPRSPKSDYSDDQLSANDRANLALIEESESKLRKDFDRQTPLFLHERTRTGP